MPNYGGINQKTMKEISLIIRDVTMNVNSRREVARNLCNYFEIRMPLINKQRFYAIIMQRRGECIHI